MRLVKGRELANIGGISRNLIQSTDEDLAGRVARCIEYYEDYGTLLMNHLSQSSPIMKAVLSTLTRSANEHSELNNVEVLKHYDALYKSLSVEPAEFLGKLDSRSESAIKEITPDNIADFLEQELLFEHGIAFECDLTRHLIETTKAWLQSLDVDAWRNVLEDQHSSQFRVICLLLEAEKLKSIPEDADTAYRDLLFQFAKGEFALDANQGWSILYMKSDKRKLKTTAKNIRDLFISDREISPEKFMALSEILLKYGSLRERSPDVVRRILELVVMDADCLEFILGNAEELIPVINRAGDDASGLKDTIRKMSMDSGASDELKKFARKI